MDQPNQLTAPTDPHRYYAMPPVGLSEVRARTGTDIRVQYTIRCGADDCWFVGHAATSGDAQTLLDGHECPTPPQRNELPSGRTMLQKTWDELDAVVWAISEKQSYNGMAGDRLVGYAAGVAFTLTMMTHPWFRTVKHVSVEARRRYKMRKGEIPFEPTPGYKFNPMQRPDVSIIRTTPAEKKAPVKRAARKAIPPPPPVDETMAKAAMMMIGKQPDSVIMAMTGITQGQLDKLKAIKGK